MPIAHGEHTQPAELAEPEELLLPVSVTLTPHEGGGIGTVERPDTANRLSYIHDDPYRTSNISETAQDSTPTTAPENPPEIRTNDAPLDTPTRQQHSPVHAPNSHSPSPVQAHTVPGARLTIHNDRSTGTEHAANVEGTHPPLPEARTGPHSTAPTTQLAIHSAHDVYGGTGRPSSPPVGPSSSTPPPAPARTDIGDVAARVIEAKLRKTEALVAVLMVCVCACRMCMRAPISVCTWCACLGYTGLLPSTTLNASIRCLQDLKCCNF